MKAKYANGMYASTSRRQDKTALDIFASLKDCSGLVSMGMNFDQSTGLCEYSYKLRGQLCEYVITIDRAGNVINRAWEG